MCRIGLHYGNGQGTADGVCDEQQLRLRGRQYIADISTLALSADTEPALSGLIAGDVHLWLCPEGVSPAVQLEQAADKAFSQREMHRYASIGHPARARQFLRSRLLLRGVLARYLDMSPQDVPLAETSNGKPHLIERALPLSFSLSHAGNAVILAVSTYPAIGVDLESVDRAESAYRISRHFFSPEEQRLLESISSGRCKLALSLWTLKESLAKAQDQTIWQGLSRNYFWVDGSRISVTGPSSPDGQIWKLVSGQFYENYVLSLAICGSRIPPHPKQQFTVFRCSPTETKEITFKPELMS